VAAGSGQKNWLMKKAGPGRDGRWNIRSRGGAVPGRETVEASELGGEGFADHIDEGGGGIGLHRAAEGMGEFQVIGVDRGMWTVQ